MIYSTLAAGLDESRLRRLSNPLIVREFDLSQPEDVEQATQAESDAQFAIIYAFTMILFISLLLTNNYLMQTVVEERNNRIIEILLSTVSPTQLLSGKILAMGTLGLLQMVVWLSGAYIALQVSDSVGAFGDIATILNIGFTGELIPLGIIYFLLMYLLYASVFGMIGAVSGSAQEGSQYAAIILIPVIIPFYLFSLIEAAPNGVVAQVMTYIPFTAPITTMYRILLVDLPLIQVALSILSVAVTAVGAMWLAGRVFRVQTLLGGKRYKVTDIPRIIFLD